MLLKFAVWIYINKPRSTSFLLLGVWATDFTDLPHWWCLLEFFLFGYNVFSLLLFFVSSFLDYGCCHGVWWCWMYNFLSNHLYFSFYFNTFFRIVFMVALTRQNIWGLDCLSFFFSFFYHSLILNW